MASRIINHEGQDYRLYELPCYPQDAEIGLPNGGIYFFPWAGRWGTTWKRVVEVRTAERAQGSDYMLIFSDMSAVGLDYENNELRLADLIKHRKAAQPAAV